MELVARGTIAARSRLLRLLGGGKCGMARTAISHSVGRLGLVGAPMGGKHSGCSINDDNSSSSDTGFCSVFSRSMVSITTTNGVYTVGYFSKATGTTTTTISTVGLRGMITALTNSSAVFILYRDSSRTQRFALRVGTVLGKS